MSSILDIKNLSFGYDKDYILENLNLEISNNEFVALIGENGCGKSTLLNLVLGNLKLDRGSIKLFQDSIYSNNHYSDIAYISQNSVLYYKDFPTTVEELIKITLRFLKKKIDIKKYLEIVELENHAKNTLSELSGGQLQRVALVLALIKDAKFIILDEPTSGIDKKFSQELFKMLRKLCDKEHTILMVTHNLSEVLSYTDRVIQLKNKQCHELTEKQRQREIELWG